MPHLLPDRSNSRRRPRDKNKNLLSLVVALLATLVALPGAQAQEDSPTNTFMLLNGDPTQPEFIAQGEDVFHYETADIEFIPTVNFDNGVSVQVDVRQEGQFLERWHFNFAGYNEEPLIEGANYGATRFPFQDADSAGMSVTGDGRGCNRSLCRPAVAAAGRRRRRRRAVGGGGGGGERGRGLVYAPLPVVDGRPVPHARLVGRAAAGAVAAVTVVHERVAGGDAGAVPTKRCGRPQRAAPLFLMWRRGRGVSLALSPSGWIHSMTAGNTAAAPRLSRLGLLDCVIASANVHRSLFSPCTTQHTASTACIDWHAYGRSVAVTKWQPRTAKELAWTCLHS